MTKGINVLSLFDGMSCGQIALERVGALVNNYFASEVDKYAIKIAQKNYPNTIQLGDVCDVRGANLPKIDLLIGGSPCQGFSLAGKQRNFDDPRSKLFFEYVRILKEVKPKYFLLENVVMKKEYQDVISEQLGVDPIEINSSLVSAQNRRRLYWTNIPSVVQPDDCGILLADELEGGSTDREKSYCLDANYYKGGNLKSYYEKHRRQLIFLEDGSFRKLTPVECERLQTVPGNYTEGVSNTQRYKMLGNGWTVDVVAHILKGINVKTKKGQGSMFVACTRKEGESCEYAIDENGRCIYVHNKQGLQLCSCTAVVRESVCWFFEKLDELEGKNGNDN